MGRHQRNKGKRGEREWAAWLRDKLGLNARRGQQFRGTPDSPDVIDGIPGTYCEVKRVEALNLGAAMAKAIEETNGDIPYVAHRRNNCPWLVTVRAEDLKNFAKAVTECS